MTEPLIPDVYCDGVQVGLSPFTAIFMLTMQPAGQTVNTPPVRVANIRMSLEHAKVMAILLRKQLKAFEAGAGVTIQIPPQVYQQLGISKLEDW